MLYPFLSDGIESVGQSAVRNRTLSGNERTSSGITLRLPRFATPVVSISGCASNVVSML